MIIELNLKKFDKFYNIDKFKIRQSLLKLARTFIMLIAFLTLSTIFRTGVADFTTSAFCRIMLSAYATSLAVCISWTAFMTTSACFWRVLRVAMKIAKSTHHSLILLRTRIHRHWGCGFLKRFQTQLTNKRRKLSSACLILQHEVESTSCDARRSELFRHEE